MLIELITKLQNLIQNKCSYKSITSYIGKQGEDIALTYLKKEKKYKILATNWKYKKDEIDIIAKDGEVVVFIEVKTRSNEFTDTSTHYQSVTKKKKKSLARGCKSYLKYTNPTPKHFRFDIILVKFCKNKENIIQHYSNIKLFSKYFHTLTYD